MFKKSICILAILCLFFCCPACSTANTTETIRYNPTETEGSLVVSPDEIDFEEVASYSFYEDDYGKITYIYYRCRTTNVKYVWRNDEQYFGIKSYPSGGLTAMLDPETGGPLTYENWLAYLETKT